MTKRQTPWVMLAAALAFGLSACSDSTGPTGPFEPTQDAAALLEVEQDLEQNPALASMTLIGGAPPLSPAVSPLQLVRSAVDPSATERVRAQLSAWATPNGFALSEVIPPAERQRTYVYNPNTGQYEHDPERTDAPTNGVRFVLYAVNPITYEPVQPLTEVGYVDLLDQSSGTTNRLRVIAVVEDETYVDYLITGSGSQSSVVADLVGYVTNGEQRVNFDIRAEIDIVGEDFFFDVVLDAVTRGVRVHLSADERYDANTGAFEELVLVYEVRTPRGTVRFGVTFTETTVSGDIRWGGRIVVTIEGDETSVTFTKEDGTTLTAEEQAALEELFDGPDALLAFLEFVSAPQSFIG